MKQLFYRFVGVFIMGVASITSVALAQWTTVTTTTNIKEGSFSKQYVWWLPDVPGSTSTQDFSTWVENVIKWIQNVINRVLGLLALVAVIILIYTGVKMLVNSSDDAAITEWYKTVKNIFIALLFIGASWLIVRFIFYVIGLLV